MFTSFLGLVRLKVPSLEEFLKAHAASNGDLSLRPVVKEKTENASSQSFPHGRTEANEPQTPVRLALSSAPASWRSGVFLRGRRLFCGRGWCPAFLRLLPYTCMRTVLWGM